MKSENNIFRMGIRDGFPICLGYLSVSFAFGISATGVGLAVWQTLLISMFNVTSAGQLAAIPIIAALGSIAELVLTQLIINLRYSLMGISLSQRLGGSVRMRDRFLIAFVNTDEVFAVATSKGTPLGRKYFYGLILTPYLGWSLGTLVGAVAGNLLPPILISALGIAIYGMFVAIVVPDVKSDKRVAALVLSSATLSCLFKYLPYLSEISVGFVIIIISVTVSAVFAKLFPIADETVEDVASEDGEGGALDE